jgi:hypothetical protein
VGETLAVSVIEVPVVTAVWLAASVVVVAVVLDEELGMLLVQPVVSSAAISNEQQTQVLSKQWIMCVPLRPRSSPAVCHTPVASNARRAFFRFAGRLTSQPRRSGGNTQCVAGIERESYRRPAVLLIALCHR